MQKNILNNLQMIDTSYMLDPSVVEGKEVDLAPGTSTDTTIEIDKLIPFRDHPFHVNTGEESFKQLMDSIKEQGVIYPIVVRPIKDEAERYEILAGHCRTEACKELGLDTIPARIIDADDLLATIIMTHSNISGRDKIALSEKAKAYRMCMDQEKHQGIDKGYDTASVVGANKDSRRQVYRFVRLSYLIPEFMDMLDRGRISVQVAYELAFISEAGQEVIYHFCEDYKHLPSLDEAQALRVRDENTILTHEMVVDMLVRPPVKKPAANVSFKTKDLAAYFKEDTEPEEMTNVIIKLLEKYKSGELTI